MTFSDEKYFVKIHVDTLSLREKNVFTPALIIRQGKGECGGLSKPSVLGHRYQSMKLTMQLQRIALGNIYVVNRKYFQAIYSK